MSADRCSVHIVIHYKLFLWGVIVVMGGGIPFSESLLNCYQNVTQILPLFRKTLRTPSFDKTEVTIR